MNIYATNDAIFARLLWEKSMKDDNPETDTFTPQFRIPLHFSGPGGQIVVNHNRQDSTVSDQLLTDD